MGKVSWRIINSQLMPYLLLAEKQRLKQLHANLLACELIQFSLILHTITWLREIWNIVQQVLTTTCFWSL